MRPEWSRLEAELIIEPAVASAETCEGHVVPLLPTFTPFPKIPRLSRACTITEKIDGTNGSILIADDAKPFLLPSGVPVPFLVGSRNRWITIENDNYGFARWAYAHATELLRLGPGQHFGEWWGSGIQRRYNQTKKRFSLFNTGRWLPVQEAGELPDCVSLVPVLYMGIFSTGIVDETLERLKREGSKAAPGFMDPEGVIVYQSAGRCYFKKTIKGDAGGKGSEE